MKKSAQKPMNIRIGADIGGTFTDIVLEKNKEFFSTKVLTTSYQPEVAVLEGIVEVTEKANVDLATISQIIHGTTLATNALIERKGAKTALITTKGFRDVIEMRTESRFEQYDLNLSMPEPLISREHRYVVEERMNSDGIPLIPINEDEVKELVQILADRGYESIAVGLIHSYANDFHERYLKKIISKHLPETMVSISSEVSPQMREYERFNTVSANAYIKPLMRTYLLRLQKKLLEQKIRCPIFLMHSGGGIISLKSAADFPVRLIESGPAGGAVFASTLAKAHKIKNILSFDMGGTTAKICLIKDQKPKTSRVFEVARSYRFKKGSGMPISIPVIDMVEIGAGGGSLASVDELQQIRVGPKSAGSTPGPACYGLGGTLPAVTDADLLLGKLIENDFAKGSIKLDKNASQKALKLKVGDKIALDEKMVAHGISEVVDENMANAARMHAVENGEDLSEFTMIAFGGAAPLHASRMCEKLGIKGFLIPKGAGVGSALGFLNAPFSFEATRSVYSTIAELDRKIARNIFSELEKEATAFVRSCDPKAKIQSEFKLFMRYKGQGWEIPVNIKSKDAYDLTGKKLQNIFEIEYKKIFGRIVKDIEVEVVIWSVNSFTPLKKIKELNSQKRKNLLKILETRTMFDSKLGRDVKAKVIKRSHLMEGDQIIGPAMIIEDETTVILTSNFVATIKIDKAISVHQKM